MSPYIKLHIMKKNCSQIKITSSRMSLEIDPSDTVLWKLAMLFDAIHNPDTTIEDIASKYGYKRETFYQIFDKLKTGGSRSLENKPCGPKHNYKRTNEATKQAIRLRFLDPEANSEVITQKLKQIGFSISQRSIERIIGEYGLQKKGYIKQLREIQKQKNLKH